jgi:hypothetical protein
LTVPQRLQPLENAMRDPAKSTFALVLLGWSRWICVEKPVLARALVIPNINTRIGPHSHGLVPDPLRQHNDRLAKALTRLLLRLRTDTRSMILVRLAAHREEFPPADAKYLSA